MTAEGLYECGGASAHQWTCGPCALPWKSSAHRIGRGWRGNPGQLVPYRQWIRENLPSGKNGFVLCGDDGFLRIFSNADPIGYVFPLEVKSNGTELDFATSATFHALSQGRLAPALILQMSGEGANVPGPLRHWPESCEHCGLPGELHVAESVRLNGRAVKSSDELANLLSHPFSAL